MNYHDTLSDFYELKHIETVISSDISDLTNRINNKISMGWSLIDIFTKSGSSDFFAIMERSYKDYNRLQDREYLATPDCPLLVWYVSSSRRY